MEVTKWLKPSDSKYGDSASVQAVTRVNAEQALYGAFIVKRFQSSDLSFLLSRSHRVAAALHAKWCQGHRATDARS
jgi:hypothetical protein